MRLNTLKSKIANKTKAFVIGGLCAVGAFIYLIRYDEIPLSLQLLALLPFFLSILLALLPITLTIVFIRLIMIINKDQSTVDYLTYVDQIMLNNFNWDEDPVTRLIGQVERKIQGAQEQKEEFARGLLPQGELSASRYSLEDISDIPDYDPEGPSPFKKKDE